MISIVTKYTEDAKKEHCNNLSPKIKRKIYGASLPKYLKVFLDFNLLDILTAEPKKLLEINYEFHKLIKGKDKKRFNSKIRRIFNYDSFIDKKNEYNSYNFAENLHINCCPNCNRQYTITINNKNKEGQITRPDFDHYFPQSQHPILALSFYNLIPSCKICNSTFKGDKPLELNTHIHPYLDNVINDFSFDYIPSSKERDTCERIVLKYHTSPNKNRIENTFKLFKIEETYNGHKFIVDRILQLKAALNDDYLKILTENTYDGINWTPEEAYRFGFGVNYNDQELFEHPFSKLKRDILTKEEMLSIFETE